MSCEGNSLLRSWYRIIAEVVLAIVGKTYHGTTRCLSVSVFHAAHFFPIAIAFHVGLVGIDIGIECDSRNQHSLRCSKCILIAIREQNGRERETTIGNSSSSAIGCLRVSIDCNGRSVAESNGIGRLEIEFPIVEIRILRLDANSHQHHC